MAQVRSFEPSSTTMISLLGQVWLTADSSVSVNQCSALKAGIRIETKGGVIVGRAWSANDHRLGFIWRHALLLGQDALINLISKSADLRPRVFFQRIVTNDRTPGFQLFVQVARKIGRDRLGKRFGILRST